MKGFQSKIEPDDMKWKIFQKNPQKKGAEAFPVNADLQKTETYLLSSG